MRKRIAFALALALVGSVWADRYTGAHPYGNAWGLVDAFNGVSSEYWPFRPYNTPGISVAGTNNGRALRNNVAITYPDVITVDNTAATGRNLGDNGDKRIYTSSPAWAPPEVYQIEVWGASENTVGGLTPGATYIAEIHFAETYNANQNRIFRCKANGVTLVCGVKPSDAGFGAAHTFSAQVQADAEGKITFVINSYSDNGIFGGYAVWGTSAPTWSSPSITGEGTDVKIRWSNGRDALRYYVESSDSADGPWMSIATLLPGTTEHTVSSAYNPSIEKYWRVVASNGVGTVVHQAKLGGAASIVYTDLATRGETVASNGAANYRVARDGTGALNRLGAATTEAAMYVNGFSAAHTLAIAVGETLKTGGLGVLSGAGDMTVGDTAGVGAVSPNAGTLNLDVKDAASVLTLNSPIVKLDNNDSLIKFGAGTVKLAGGTDVAHFSIGHGAVELPYATDAEFDKTLSGAGTFVKSGAGTLNVKNESRTFAGTVQVKEGTLLAGKDEMASAFGDGLATVEVKSGGTLDVGNPSATGDNNVRFGATKIVIEGAGAGGKGALVNSSGRSQYNALRNVELAADATVNATGRFDLRSEGGAQAGLKLNNHVLAKEGGGSFILTSVPVEAGGSDAKIRVKNGMVGAEATTTFNGEGAFEFETNGAFEFYNLGSAVAWPLFVKSSGGRFACRAGNYDGQNTWAGSVMLEEGARLNMAANDNTSFRVTGKITGPGSIGRDGGGTIGRVKIENPENDYTGGTEASYGILYFPSAAALPGFNEPGRVTVSNQGKLLVKMGDGGANGWSFNEIKALVENATAPEGASGAIVIDTDGRDVELETGTADKPVGIGKAGEGTLVSHRNYPVGGGLYVEGGELFFNDVGYNSFGMVEVVRTGTLRVRASEIDCGDVDTRLGYSAPANPDAPERARMVLEGDSLYHTELKPYQTASHTLYIASGAEHVQGILEVVDGAVISNRISVATSRNSQGAVYQRGGEIVNWAGWGCDGRLASGEGSYGYWEVGGGDTFFMGYSQLAQNLRSAGILSIKGGVFHQKDVLGGVLGLSRGGTGVVYQTSGRFESVHDLYLGDNNDNNATGGQGVFTIAGGTAQFGTPDAVRGVQLSNRSNFHGQVNLNGGELSTGSFWKQGGENAQTYVTFNGGTLKSMVDGKNIFGDAGYLPDGVYVFSKGAVFNTDGKDTNTLLPIQAPEGNGVQAIRYTADDMIGPPSVSILGGGGTGATAVADFDSTSGKVRGIIVTCPGWGYTSKPTVTLYGGGRRTDQPITLDAANITMGPNAAGPIVKKGEGTLALTGANGFVGVEVAGGTLSLEGATLPEGPLTLSGGTLRASSFAATEIIVNGDEETVSTLDAKVTVSGERQSARRPGLYMLFQNGEYDWLLKATEENHVDIVTDLAYADVALGDGVTSVFGYPFANKQLGCIWDGYIWNRTEETVTWTFAEFFDDNVYLKIDDTVVLNNEQWDLATLGTISLEPGPHAFHLVVWQGTGGSGPSANDGADNAWMKNTGLGIAVDFEGRGEQVAANFQPLADDGDGTLFTLTTDEFVEPEFAPPAAVHVNGGTLRLVQSSIGLYGGFLSGGNYRTSASPATGVWQNLDYANKAHQETDVVEGVENRNVDYVFEGYIWNHGASDATWTFVENFDDSVYLTIDGRVVLDNGGWDAPTKANVTLAPGPHAIRIGLHQGGGGSGPSAQGWLGDGRIGIGIDFEGRDAEVAVNYTPLTATANGGELPLLTTAGYLPSQQTIPADAPFAISGSAKVDLGGASFELNELYSGAGAFENGTLAVNGTWTIDYADIVAGGTLAVEAVDLSRATIMFTGTPELNRNERYPLLTSQTEITSAPHVATALPRGWKVMVRGGNTLSLMYSGCTLLYMR